MIFAAKTIVIYGIFVCFCSWNVQYNQARTLVRKELNIPREGNR